MEAGERHECPRCARFGPMVPCEHTLICEDCESRLTELERVPPTAWNVLRDGVKVAVRAHKSMAALVLIAALPVVIVRWMVWDIPPILTWILDVLVEGAALYVAFSVIQERRPQLSRSLRRSGESIVRLFITAFLVRLQLVALGVAPLIVGLLLMVALPDFSIPLLLVAFVAGVALLGWRAPALILALPIALHEPGGSPIRGSTRRTKGRRLPGVAIALFATVGWVAPLVLWIYLWAIDLIASAAVLLSQEPAPAAVSDTLFWGERAVSTFGPLISSSVAVMTAAMVAVLYARTTRIKVY